MSSPEVSKCWNEIDVSQLDPYACDGGWRMLCSSVMLQAVMLLCGKAIFPHSLSGPKSPNTGTDQKLVGPQRKAALEWLKGGGGVVSLGDCCDAMDIDIGRARSVIEKGIQDREERDIARTALRRRP